MKIALDPYMLRSTPLLELPALVADLGYEYIELSPREDFMPFFLHAARGRREVKAFKKALDAAGVKIASQPAALPLVRTGRGRAPGCGAVLEARHRDHRPARLQRDELRVQRPAREGQRSARASSGSRWRSCSPSSSARASSSGSSRTRTTSSRTAWSPSTWCEGSTRRSCPSSTAPRTRSTWAATWSRSWSTPVTCSRTCTWPTRFDHTASSGLRYITNPPGNTGPGAPAPRHRPGRGRVGRVLRDPQQARLRRLRPQHHDLLRLRLGGAGRESTPLHARDHRHATRAGW